MSRPAQPDALAADASAEALRGSPAPLSPEEQDSVRQGSMASPAPWPEFWGEVQPPASLKGLDIPSRRAVFVPWKPSTRLFVEEPMLSTGLHFASESTW